MRIFPLLKCVLFLVLLTYCTPAFTQEPIQYQVKPGDRIPTILQVLGIHPLWGENGTVAQTYQLNPGVAEEPTPGTWIQLPAPPKPTQNQKTPTPQVPKTAGNVFIFNIYCAPGGNGSIPPSQIPPSMKGSGVQLNIQSFCGPQPTPRSIVHHEPTALITRPPAAISTQTSLSNRSFKNLDFITSFDYFAINATDTSTQDQATFVSNPSYRAGIRWSQYWNKTFTTFLDLETRKLDFITPTNRTLNQSQLRHHFGVGLRTTLTSKLTFIGIATLQQRNSIEFSGTNTLAINAPFVPSIQVIAQYNLFNWGKIKLGSRAGSGLFLPAGNLGTGVRLNGSLFATRPMTKIGSLGVELTYAQDSQGSSVVSQTTQQTGISLFYQIRWGGARK